MSQGKKGSRKQKTLADFEPLLAERILSAWFDIEVYSEVLRKRFHLSGDTMNDLSKDLGPRKRFIRVTPARGTSPRARITNGHHR